MLAECGKHYKFHVKQARLPFRHTSVLLFQRLLVVALKGIWMVREGQRVVEHVAVLRGRFAAAYWAVRLV